jgi:hypothetical protein
MKKEVGRSTTIPSSCLFFRAEMASFSVLKTAGSAPG